MNSYLVESFDAYEGYSLYRVYIRAENTPPDQRAERTAAYELPSLLKSAYYACNRSERNRFDTTEAPDVDLRRCCESLFEVLRAGRTPDEDRANMYDRSPSRGNDPSFICEEAAGHGHMDCLRLAREIGVPWHYGGRRNKHPDTPLTVGSACEMAARSGNLECLRYALENGCRMDKFTCAGAALNGHLDCLVYAREHECPWDALTCFSAAKNGHLRCLVYARENGCPWDSRTYSIAKLKGHEDCLNYALENGCPKK